MAQPALLGLSILVLAVAMGGCGGVEVDFSRYEPGCEVLVEQDGEHLQITWPMEGGEFGRVVLNLDGDRPLIEQLGISVGYEAEADVLMAGVDPSFFLTVGTRQMPDGKPANQTWMVQFDKPATRRHRTYLAELKLRHARVWSEGRRATVALGDLGAGQFSGELRFTFYAESALMRVQAVQMTKKDRCAIIYDAGILGLDPDQCRLAWMDTEGTMQWHDPETKRQDRSLAVRYRAILAESKKGSVSCFPLPHQFQFPRDFTENLKFTWMGTGHQNITRRFGFGVRQEKEGPGYVPWFNAPPGTEQRLGVFFLLSSGRAEDALAQTLRYTRGDRFEPLPGHLTMTGHWHIEAAMSAIERRKHDRGDEIPEFVHLFKQMGVNMVHLAEFHPEGHQMGTAPQRLPELKVLYEESRRLSDEDFLLIPGEEIPKFLGIAAPGKHPGHWMSLFPKPLYWLMQRNAGEPFIEEHPQYGTVYRVGNRADVVRLIEAEGALVWSAHPRIKASSWAPDIFRHEDFYLADSWLGGAWKAMPGDLSQPRLGKARLDVLDDMLNWGQKKFMVGEVDVFKIDHTQELFAHMNINYVRLDRLPHFDEGWQPLLDALRAGAFFVTTGEILIRDFSIDGTPSGQTLAVKQDIQPHLHVELDWTFPLAFAEVVSGDGARVYRMRIDLSDTSAFGRRTIQIPLPLHDRRWVRFEVWDVAANGAFTQPIWLDQRARSTSDAAAP